MFLNLSLKHSVLVNFTPDKGRVCPNRLTELMKALVHLILLNQQYLGSQMPNCFGYLLRRSQVFHDYYRSSGSDLVWCRMAASWQSLDSGLFLLLAVKMPKFFAERGASLPGPNGNQTACGIYRVREIRCVFCAALPNPRAFTGTWTLRPRG